MISKIVLTGGAGFVGSHIADYLAHNYKDTQIIIFDKLTYAGNLENIKHALSFPNVTLCQGDICDFELCKAVLTNTDLLIHAAAESHVDNSFGNSLLFTKTNTLGTHTLFEACRILNIKKIIHISTDEVYGEILKGHAKETQRLCPTNPYAASKAAAEQIAHSYYKSYKLPVVILRMNNIYGIRQYPEKIIPKFILKLILGQKLTIHGTGKYVRHYLAVEDFINALDILIKNFQIGSIYNIGSDDGYSNLEIVEMLCKIFCKPMKNNIVFVKDRPFNDARYSVSSREIKRIGWKTTHSLAVDIEDIVSWYKEELRTSIHTSKLIINT